MKMNISKQGSFENSKINMDTLRQFFMAIPNGMAFHKIIIDQNKKPIDYVFLEVNEAFEKITGLHRSDILNKRITTILPGIVNDPSDWIGMYGNVAITGVAENFESHSAHLNSWYSVIATCPEKGFFLTIFEDITERKTIEKEREELIADLRSAISEIKQLRGIIPICASCKNIRNDKGAWMQIEAYIQKHSEAKFSHGICPECSKKLYPELDHFETE